MSKEDEVFNRVWDGMVKNYGQFSSLSLREREALKETIKTLFLSTIGTMRMAMDMAASQTATNTNNLLHEDLKLIKEKLEQLCLSGSNAQAAKSFSDTVPSLSSDVFSTEGVKTNIQEVKIDKKEVSGVEDAIERLRKSRNAKN